MPTLNDYEVKKAFNLEGQFINSGKSIKLNTKQAQFLLRSGHIAHKAKAKK